MQNGTYLLTQKGLNNRYKLVVYNGKMKLLNIESDEYIKSITDKDLTLHYVLGDRLPGSQNTYDIAWIVNGKQRERMRIYVSYAVAKYRIAELKKSSNYKSGLLIPIRSDKHEI